MATSGQQPDPGSNQKVSDALSGQNGLPNGLTLQFFAQFVNTLTDAPPEQVLELWGKVQEAGKRKAQRDSKTQTWVSLIPGTRAFRRRVVVKASEYSGYGLFLFFIVKDIPFDERVTLRSKSRRLQHQSSIPDATTEISKEFLAKLLIWSGIPLSFVVPFVAAHRWHLRLLTWPSLAEILLLEWALWFLFVAQCFLLGQTLREDKTVSKSGALAVVFFVPIVVGVASFFWLHRLAAGNQDAILRTALLFEVSLCALVLTHTVSVNAMFRIKAFLKVRRCPQAVVLDAFLLIHAAIVNSKFSFASANQRALLLRRLEGAAAAFEKVAGTVKSYDWATQTWMASQMQETANFVRELKKWVLTPKNDTLIRLRIQLAWLIKLILNDDWDAMPRSPSQTIPPPRRLWHRVVPSLKVVLGSSIPLLTLLGSQGRTFVAKHPWYGAAGLAIWVIVLLTISDSQRIDWFSDVKRIEMLRDTFQPHSPKE